MDPRPTSFLAPLRHPFFRLLWIATLFSNFGTWIQSVGAAWMMTSLAPSADMVALAQAATALPTVAFSLAAGAVADIWDRRADRALIERTGSFHLGPDRPEVSHLIRRQPGSIVPPLPASDMPPF
jgi:MFS family permease